MDIDNRSLWQIGSPRGRNESQEQFPMTAVARTRGHSIGTRLGRQIGVAALFFVTGYVGMKATVGGSVVTPVWPPSGVALAAILAFGYRMGYGISVGSFLLNLTVGLAPGTAAAIAICNNLEYMGGAFLLRRLAGFHLSLDRRQDVIALIFLAAVLATTFSAVPGVTILTAAGQVPLHDFGWVFLKWWLSGMMGVLIVAPLLLVLLTHPWPRIPLERAIEAGALVVLLIGILALIFETRILGNRGYYPAVLAVFPFAIWGALRFGLWGATLLNLFIAGLAVWETRQGVGPFVSNSPVDSLLRWAIFTNVMAITDLLLAAMAAEQRWARYALKQSHDELERRVSERTAELAQINDGLKQEMAVRRHLESELLQAGERQQQAFGRELHDGVGQQLTSIAFFGAALRQRLEDRSQPGGRGGQAHCRHGQPSH